MKVVDGIHVLTYDEWVKRADVSDMLLDVEDCPTCDGDGEHECECGHTHDCGACMGSGKSEDFRELYESSLREELKNLLAWKNGDPIKPSNRLNPYKRVEPVIASFYITTKTN